MKRKKQKSEKKEKNEKRWKNSNSTNSNEILLVGWNDTVAFSFHECMTSFCVGSIKCPRNAFISGWNCK